MNRSQEGEGAIWLAIAMVVIAALVIHTWNYHEARHNRIECAEFNADASNLGYPENGKPHLVDIKACHPAVK